jgi:hypothetical protein
MRISQYVFITHPNDSVSLRVQNPRSPIVICCPEIMAVAINFNHNLALNAGEVHHIRANGVLTPESHSCELPSPKH